MNLSQGLDPLSNAVSIFRRIAEDLALFRSSKEGERMGSRIRARLRDLPTMVRTFGLAASVAYLCSKRSCGEGKNEYDYVLDALERYMRTIGYMQGGESGRSSCECETLIEAALNADNDPSRFEMILDFLVAMKRLAEARWEEAEE